MRAWWEDAPHEVCLLALGALVALLLLSSAPASAAPAIVACALYATAIRACAAGAAGRWSGVAWRLRCAAAYAFTLWIYGAIRWITPALGLTLRDDVLLATDAWLLGQTPALTWAPHASLWLTELMSAGYMSYHLYLHGALLWALALSAERARRLYAYLFVVFAFGIGGYLVVPAVGPLRAVTFDAALPGGPITRFQDAFIAAGTSVYDVFPSLHIALTLSLLLHDWREHRLRFWLLLPSSLILAASTLYLRYHYAVDLLAGALLAALVRAWFVWRERARPITTPSEG